MFKSIRRTLAVAAIAAFTTIGLTSSANAQMFGDRGHEEHTTIGVGAGYNTNFASGDYNPAGNNSTFMRGTWHTPSFHIAAEIPMTSELAFQPRISYNDLSGKLDQNEFGSVPSSSSETFTYRTIGADALLKYSVVGGLHVLGGAGIGAAIQSTYTAGSNSVHSSIMTGSQMPNTPRVLFTGIAGAGYDVPLSEDRMWITPEVDYTVPLNNLAQGTGDGDLRVNSLSSKVTLKMALDR